MVLEVLWSLFRRVFDTLLKMLGVNSSPPRLGDGLSPNSLRVNVKYAGRSIPVGLDPSWSVARVKEEIGPLLRVDPKEIKIIFAGTELPDGFILEVGIIVLISIIY